MHTLQTGMSRANAARGFGPARPLPLRLLIGAFLILTISFTSTAAGLYLAHGYVRGATVQMSAVVPASAGFQDALEAALFDLNAAEEWRARDAERVADLVDDWPFSIPIILAEIALFQSKRHHVRASAQESERGYRVSSVAAGGIDHLLSVAVQGRVRALTRQWTREEDRLNWLTYGDQPLAPQPGGVAVRQNDVVALLDDLPLPDDVFANLHITLLPFVLDDTAGLASKGNIVLGAAPAASPVADFERTAYALVHELGHHIHYTYGQTWNGRAKSWWHEYVALRGIRSVTGSSPWEWLPEETFAEDFRLLFGPAAARTVPHGTVYGDPLDTSDGGLAIRRLMSNVLSM